MIKRIRAAWKYSHIRAIIWTILVLIISGIASIALFNCCGALSAILASICAGCVTGIVFFVITNKRNNEIGEINEEFEETRRQCKEARRIKRLCKDAIENPHNSEETIEEICRSTKKLEIYMSTICFDAPKTTQIIKDYPPDYNELEESASKAIALLESSAENGLSEEQIKMALAEIMLYCSATEGILLKPWIHLMSEIKHLEEAVF